MHEQKKTSDIEKQWYMHFETLGKLTDAYTYIHTPQKSLVLFSKNLKGAYFWLDIFCKKYVCKGKTEFDFSLMLLATKVNLEMQN